MVVAGVVAVCVLTVRSDAGALAQDGPADPLRLDLAGFLALAAENSQRIRHQRIETSIAGDAIDNARSIFEPMLTLSTQTKRSFVDNTLDTDGDYYNIYDRTAAVGVEFLSPIGTKMNLGISQDDQKKRPLENATGSFVSTPRDRNGVKYEAGITQPLLKNAGYDATTANIRIVRRDHDIARQQEQQTLAEVVHEAGQAFLDLRQAQSVLLNREEALTVARGFATEARSLARNGFVPDGDIIDAEAGVSLRQAQADSARQEVAVALANARTILFTDEVTVLREIVATGDPVFDRPRASLGEMLETALNKRPEIIAAQYKIDRERIRTEYAENQDQIELNLVAGTTQDEYLRKSRMGYYIGLEARVPILGGLKSTSEVSAAHKRESQAFLERDAARAALGTNLRSLISQEDMLHQQVVSYREAVHGRKQLFDDEMIRFREGRAAARDVLRRQDDLLQQSEILIVRSAGYGKIALSLEYTKGTLLDMFALANAPPGQ